MITLYQASLLFEDLSKGGTKLGVGIHTAVDVTSIEKGENYVDINFAKDGKVMNKRLWEATGNYPLKDKDGKLLETKAQAIEREEKRNLSHIVKLMHVFLGKEVIASFPELGYDDFVIKAISMLKGKLSSKKVNLKVILDSEGVYSVLGNFPDYVEEFIEGQEVGLKYSEYETKNRITPKAATVKKDDGLDNLYN